MAKTSTVIRTNRQDYDMDGDQDYIFETTTVSDRKGNVLSIQEKGDYSPDGADGVWDWISLTENEYDRRGNMTRTEYKSDWQADGIWDSVNVTEWTYQGDKVLTEVATADYENDGQLEYVITTTNDYNRRGDLVERQMAYDWNGDGTNDQVDLYKYFYEGGQLAQETIDYYSDGVIESTTDYAYA